MIKHKVTFLFSVFFLLMLLDACDAFDPGIDCNCPKAEPFYDFDELVLLNTDLEVSASESFDFEVTPEGLEFFAIACKKNHFSFSLMPQLMACSCVNNGFDGLKFPIEDISLTSDSNWSDELAAGENLSDLLLTKRFGDLESINTFYGDPFFLIVDEQNLFQINDRPSVDKAHVFTLILNKSNGESVTLELPEVVWE